MASKNLEATKPLTHFYRLDFDNPALRLDLQALSTSEQHFAQTLDGYPQCLFKSSDNHPCPLAPQPIRIVQILQANRRSTVYRGQCKDVDGSDIELVIKFTASADHVDAEAENYKKLKDLQGSIVPTCYGTLREGDTGKVKCLVLQHFGEPLGIDFHDLPREDV